METTSYSYTTTSLYYILDKHGVPPTKRLFRVAMLDPSQGFIDPWGKFGDLELPSVLVGKKKPESSRPSFSDARGHALHNESTRVMIGCEVLGSFSINNFEVKFLEEENPPEQSRLGILFCKEILKGGMVLVVVRLCFTIKVYLHSGWAENVSRVVAQNATMAKSIASHISSNGGPVWSNHDWELTCLLQFPIGLEIDRSASSSVMQVGVRSGSESFSQTENGIRLMLAPRSANAKHSSIPGNSQDSGKLARVSTFLGNLFKDDRRTMFNSHRSSSKDRGATTGINNGLKKLDFEIDLNTGVGRLRCFAFSKEAGWEGRGRHRVLCHLGRASDPEVEALFAVTNLKACPVNLIWDCGFELGGAGAGGPPPPADEGAGRCRQHTKLGSLSRAMLGQYPLVQQHQMKQLGSEDFIRRLEEEKLVASLHLSLLAASSENARVRGDLDASSSVKDGDLYDPATSLLPAITETERDASFSLRTPCPNQIRSFICSPLVAPLLPPRYEDAHSYLDVQVSNVMRAAPRYSASQTRSPNAPPIIQPCRRRSLSGGGRVAGSTNRQLKPDNQSYFTVALRMKNAQFQLGAKGEGMFLLAFLAAGFAVIFWSLWLAKRLLRSSAWVRRTGGLRKNTRGCSYWRRDCRLVAGVE
ncbi:hypothetical protein Tco_1247281 [Tanacetum coccineum]